MRYLVSLVLALFCVTAVAQTTFLNVKTLGAYGDGTHNDYTVLQDAVDSAASIGATVFFPVGNYKIDQTLVIPAGVSLVGAGRGLTATGTPALGSIIINSGTAVTLSVRGTNVAITDMVIYDDNNAGAAGGIELLGDGKIVEGVVLRQVLISGFTDGVALKLKAINSGGLTYCSFYDVRIRYGATGVKIEEEAGSFVNSNSFYHGAISGDGFDYGIRVSGGNNNVFNGTVVEPYSSAYGHLVVEKGEFTGAHIRIEGSNQSDTIPLVEFKAGTRNSYVTGIYSGGLTIDNGDNYVGFRAAKSFSQQLGRNNLYQNAAFYGVKNGQVPYWQMSGVDTVMEVSDVWRKNMKVLQVEVAAGASGYLRPDPIYLPEYESSPAYQQVNFGAFIKTDVSNFVTTTSRSPSGLVTGGYHPGDGQWHSIGMTSLVDTTQSYDPKFYFNNTTGAKQSFYITAPALSFGYAQPQTDHYLTANGGVVNGTITYGLGQSYQLSGGFLVLPGEGNIFTITGAASITRINHLTADRMPAGTMITLLLDSGATLVKSAYLKLVTSYTASANGSITLVSMGDGTWREISRAGS
ncbi:glycoside hydrolase family 55 protein [Fulvivirga maritima]|uniref:glycoside hydrolase family 55 protein n=1 Tax=Fulvivirga maritima TaxID=2904247 RepID=UPI001F1FBEFA|nr:glycoside hydrolase family 55 protein [Fulvivirga maritima]UII25458.1 glycoside hydrolase family 55 protein [Fulvivirga maritima]